MDNGGAGLGNRLAPPRFVLFLVLLVAGFFGHWAYAGDQKFADAVAMSFDLAAMVFLLSLIPLVRDADVRTIRRHAKANDANRVLVLIVTTVATLVVMAAIAGELPQASAGDRVAIGKLIVTLTLTWMFANVVYALHYAHLFYSSRPGTGGDAGGLEFPGEDAPDYLDFIYFSFTMGMTFQTSDVQITSRSIRRIATLHSLAAFIFNLGVIAFTINALGGS
jgi:uncharacterized membrane protein